MYGHELVTLIIVADKGSFLKASEALYTTPASVMNQINKLEGNVGVKLFERTNQGARLTVAGRAFYEDAKQLISFAEAAIKKARQLAAPGQKVIRVGTSILRPCKRLIEWWNAIDDGSLPYQIDIVPFDDDPKSLNAVISSLGSKIDCLMETLDIWKEVHPALLTLPVEWSYEVPYGVIYAKKPAPLVAEFIGIIQKSTC